MKGRLSQHHTAMGCPKRFLVPLLLSRCQAIFCSSACTFSCAAVLHWSSESGSSSWQAVGTKVKIISENNRSCDHHINFVVGFVVYLLSCYLASRSCQ